MKNKLIIILSLASVLSWNGCKQDVLEVVPPGFPSAEGFYKSADDVSAGINGIYQTFQGDIWGGAFIHIQPHFEAATENAVICCDWEYGIAAIARGTMSPTTGSFVAWKWDYGYQAITRTNTLLNIIETQELTGMTEELKNSFVGEIKFLRAYVYAELSFLYGDVPLILELISGEEAREITRTPKAQVVEQLLNDLDEAIANLEIQPRNGEFGRPTKVAALALKGKVLLYNQRYQEAAATLQQVIDLEGSAVILDPNYESLFRGENEQSKEIIFSLQYVGKDVGAGEGGFLSIHYAPGNLDGTSASTSQGWGSFFYTRRLVDDYYMKDGLPITTSPLYDANNIFNNRDPRFKMTFFTPGDTYRGVVLTNMNFYVNGAAPKIPMTTRKWVTEKGDINFGTDVNPADLILIRYADVLMMYAEAQNEVAGPDATVYSAINKIRQRAGMPDVQPGLSKDQMRLEIRHERKIEFMMEGHHYFDLLRWRTAETVIPSIPSDEVRTFNPTKNYLWPVPQDAIDQSPNITQNPNY
jgi:starch-binding outer membrane protein, SusD/RagB family